jgi:hypothetical protein
MTFYSALVCPKPLPWGGEAKRTPQEKELNVAFQNIFKRRVAKKDAMGIHDLLFYELKPKKVYYPTRRDEEAVNPDGSRLRMLTA